MTETAAVSPSSASSQCNPTAEVNRSVLEQLKALPWKKSTAQVFREELPVDSPRRQWKVLQNHLPLSSLADRWDWLQDSATLPYLLDFLTERNQATDQPDAFPESTTSLLQMLNQQTPSGQRAKSKKTQAASNARWEKTLWGALAEEQSIPLVDVPAESIPGLAVRGLVLTRAWLRAGEKLSAELQLEMLWRLYEYACFTREYSEQPRHPEEPPLVALLVRAELRGLLGMLFEDLRGWKAEGKAARKACEVELDASTDTDGTPHTQMLPVLACWLASVHRQATVCRLGKRKFLGQKAERRWLGLLERCASLTIGKGQLALTDVSSAEWKTVLGAALLTVPNRKRLVWVRETARQLEIDLSLKSATSRPTSPRRSKKSKSVADESAASQTDWGYLACLRNNWYPGGDALAVSFLQPTISLDMRVLASSLFRGEWQTELQQDGQVIPLQEEWTALCWYSEPACDYLELRQEVGEVIVDRQLFLSRTDHFALLADSVKTSSPNSQLNLFWNLPITGNWTTRSRPEGREWLLKQKRLQVRLLPLALPQNRVHAADGSLLIRAGSLVLDQTGQHQLCMPLMLDWSPARRQAASDWSRLTITEERRRLSCREAFAARFRVGAHQWLFLRNLDYTGKPRAALGMHADAETILAEFPSTGIPERLLEVHYEED